MAQKVLVIVGPTAVGKTALSIKLAHEFNGEVISGDSMQVYQGLDIGTAKVTPTEMDGIPHYLIDILRPDQQFTVADFVSLSQAKLAEIGAQQKLPLIVGGTGLYVQALLDNFGLGATAQFTDEQVRADLEEFATQAGKQALWDRLEQIDPQAAQKIPVNNQRRVVRALEVCQVSGQLFSAQADSASGDYDPLIIGLNTERSALYQRINQRVDLMVKAGLVDEARRLYRAGGTELAAGKGIGYKELYPFFAGTAPLAACVEKIKINSRHYAKRQLTWFRNRMTVNWFDIVGDPSQQEQIKQLITSWLAE